MTKRLGFVAISVMALAACKKDARNGPPEPNVNTATKRPDNATSQGKVTTKVTPPNAPASAPQINTMQPGDDGDLEYTWQEDIDGDGTLDDVVEVLDDETGDIVFAATWTTPCDDGSPLKASLYIWRHTDGSGSYMYSSDDVCGEGAALYGCDFDTNGNDKACGSCTVPADGTDFTCQETSPPT
jgi:hypothetical protein